MAVDAPLKKQVVDAVLAAIEMSDVTQFADLGTLRYLLESGYNDLYRNGRVDLTMIWEVIRREEGVGDAVAALPCLILSLARERHGFEVVLPQALEDHPDLQRFMEDARRRLRLKDGFRLAAQEPEKPRAEARPAPERPAKRPEHAFQPAPAPRKARRRVIRTTPLRLALAGAVIAVSLVGLVLGLVRILSDDTVPIDLKEFAALLKLTDGRRLEGALTAVIEDPRWPGIPAEEKREALKALARKLSEKGISSITLTDKAGRVRATVTPRMYTTKDQTITSTVVAIF